MHATNQSNKARRRILLAGAALIAAPLAFMPGTAAAQSQASETRDFSVPAQSLSSALLRFGEQAGLQFSIDARAVEGKTASALNGRYTVEEGLRRLLAGSGLSYRFTSATTVSIEALAAGADGELVTGVVSVEGYRGSPYFGGAGVAAGVNGINGSRDITATEGTGSFTSGALTIGSKVPQALKDVPQSVSVLTSERMAQQNVTDFNSALEQLPGISFEQGGTNLENTFYSRGFEIRDIQVDGGAPLRTNFPGSTGTGYFPQIDMAQYDHVELLRGAAGLVNGYGSPGGTVNLVRKKPLDHGQVVAEVQVGSWNNYRAVLDASSPLAFDGKLRGRLVMTYQDNDYFFDVANDNKTLIYGVAELDVTPTTLVTGGISYTRQDSVPWNGGLPRYSNGDDLELPRSTSLAFPWNRWDFDTIEVFGSIEQKIGEDWLAKLNVTYNTQSSTKKVGYSIGAINFLDHSGARLFGAYEDYASEQLTAEATVSGAFEVFGQRQEITIGASRGNSNNDGLTSYLAGFIVGTAPLPYQPYPGGPEYYPGSPNGRSPAIDPFAFDPSNPLYNEPANPLPSDYYRQFRQIMTGAYANLRLTAFDRLHLTAGLRWNRYEYLADYGSLCTSIPTSGSPSEFNCVGREIGDFYYPFLGTNTIYGDDDITWPPPVSLSYDVTGQLTAYIGYTDIYQSQASYLNTDLKPIAPITGSNIEAGLKWAPNDGRLNISVSGYLIRQKGFATNDGEYADPTPEEAAAGATYVIVTDDGRRLVNTLWDSNHYCCYTSNPDQTLKSQGVDLEVAGEISRGWQISANYTYSETKQEGSYFGEGDGLPFVSIQPKHLYKLWTSYDFGAAGVSGWISGLTLSLGLNGQSSGYRSGSACAVDYVMTGTGSFRCPTGQTRPYEFTVEPYTVVSGRIDYRFSDTWSLAVNLENILDKTYYRSIGFVSGGNWYGAPRSFTATLRAKW